MTAAKTKNSFLPPKVSLPKDRRPIPPVNLAVTRTIAVRKSNGQVIEGMLLKVICLSIKEAKRLKNRLAPARSIQKLGSPGRKNIVMLAFQPRIKAGWCQRRSSGIQRPAKTKLTTPKLRY